MFNVTPESIEYIKSGKFRALAVTSISRSDALPDLPIVADFVPGFEASYWAGLGAPKNTPAEIIGKLNKEINAALADPVLKARFAHEIPVRRARCALADFVSRHGRFCPQIPAWRGRTPESSRYRLPRLDDAAGRYSVAGGRSVPASLLLPCLLD